MSETKGKTPLPSRDKIICTVVETSAFILYFDTSEEARNAGLVDIIVIDVKKPLREDVTHQFYVVINKTACYVTRTTDNAYIAEPDYDNPYFAQELNIREYVLDKALRHFTGKSSYPKDMSLIQRVLEFLGDANIRECKPVVRDEPPDILTLDAEETEIQAERQWSVQIGDYFCEIAQFGTDDNGRPKLVLLDE